MTGNEWERVLSMLGHRMEDRCSPGTLLGVAAGNGWVQVPLSALGLGCRMAGRVSHCVRLHEGKGRLHEGEGKSGWERAIE